MGKSVNKVIVFGTLGKDPEMKYTPSGAAVANFSMATNESYKDKQSGEWKEKTEWHNFVAWQKAAEVINEYVKKGDRLYVEGKLQTRSWDDKTSGQKRYATEIVVDQFVLCGNGGGKRKEEDTDNEGFE